MFHQDGGWERPQSNSTQPSVAGADKIRRCHSGEGQVVAGGAAGIDIDRARRGGQDTATALGIGGSGTLEGDVVRREADIAAAGDLRRIGLLAFTLSKGNVTPYPRHLPLGAFQDGRKPH